MTHYSIAGIVVTARAGTLTEVASHLSELPGIEVHHVEQSTNRLVITMESGSSEAGQESDQERLDGFSRVPGVVSVSLLYQYVGGPDEGDTQATNAGLGCL